MPTEGKCWWHLIFNTYATWLPGDPRGFHSRNHRKHSTGDYKSPPPAGEYAWLHESAKSKAGKPVTLPDDLWPIVGFHVLSKAAEQGHRLLTLSVDATHVHALAELPADRMAVKRIVGTWKQRASHAVRDRLPGQVWSKSCDPIRIEDEAHHRRVFHYILRHGHHGAWVWRFDHAPPDASGEAPSASA